MKMPRYIFPITFCDDCREIGMKSKFVQHDDRYMFRAYYLCKHCNGDTIAARYLREKAYRQSLDLRRDEWNELRKVLGKSQS